MAAGKLLQGLLVASVLSLAVITFILTARLQELSRSHELLRIRASLPHAGYFVPTFAARSTAGDSAVVGATAGPRHRQLVFVLTSTCPYCRRTLPTWNRLADSARRLPGWTVEVVAISLDSLSIAHRYADSADLSFPLVTFPDRKHKQLYRARAVPQTLVLDQEGRIVYARTGLLEPAEVLDSVYRALQWSPPAQPRTTQR